MLQASDSSFIVVVVAILALGVAAAVMLLRAGKTREKVTSRTGRDVLADATSPDSDHRNVGQVAEPADASNKNAGSSVDQVIEVASRADESARVGEIVSPLDEVPLELPAALVELDETEKYRIIYRFLPNMRGILLRGEALDGYFTDAVARTLKKGWSPADLGAAARSGIWRKPKAVSNRRND